MSKQGNCSFCTILFLALILLIASQYGNLQKFIESQDQHFNAVNKFNKDIDNLKMTELTELEEKSDDYNLIDEKTGRLRQTGWVKRDSNLVINSEHLKPNDKLNWLQNQVRIRHKTLIVTFSKDKISAQTLFYFGINTFAMTAHMIKGQEGPDVDPLASMASDMCVKEPAAIVYSDTRSLGAEPFSVTGSYMQWNLTEEKTFDTSKYQRVFRNQEINTHPFNFNMDFNIYIGKDDEALSLVQDQSAEGDYFMAYSSRLGLVSEGKHDYTMRHHKVPEEKQQTLTNIIIQSGAPLYGQGNMIMIQAAGWIPQKEGNPDIRFGFEFTGGIAGRPGVSTANKNAFTIDGKLYKLDTMDIQGDPNPDNENRIQSVHLKMRSPRLTPEGFKDATYNECEIWFEMSFRMQAQVPAVVLKVHEIFEQGYIHGWCYSSYTFTKHYITKLDALLMFDGNIY